MPIDLIIERGIFSSPILKFSNARAVFTPYIASVVGLKPLLLSVFTDVLACGLAVEVFFFVVVLLLVVVLEVVVADLGAGFFDIVDFDFSAVEILVLLGFAVVAGFDDSVNLGFVVANFGIIIPKN
jgi:hypothetical protein